MRPAPTFALPFALFVNLVLTNAGDGPLLGLGWRDELWGGRMALNLGAAVLEPPNGGDVRVGPAVTLSFSWRFN